MNLQFETELQETRQIRCQNGGCLLHKYKNILAKQQSLESQEHYTEDIKLN